MDAKALDLQAGGVPRDWFRPIPVGRFAVLLNSAAGNAPDGLTAIGAMVAPDGTDIDPAVDVPGWPDRVGPAPTHVLAGYDSDHLYLRVICREPLLARMRLTDPEFYRNDHVVFCIDPANDHHRYLQMLVLPDGRSQVAWQTAVTGYLPTDLSVVSEADTPAVRVSTSSGDGAWTADVTVPWASLGIARIQSGRCLGLSANRFRTVGAEQFSQWSPTLGTPRDARYFGDLYIGQPAAILQEVRLGGPHWGPNRGYVRFTASRPFWVWVEPGESVAPADARPVRLEAGPYGFAGYTFDYTIDPLDILTGRLTIRWSDGNPLECASMPGNALQDASEASFVFGWKRSILLTHTVGRASKPARPQDNSRLGFFGEMCDYLLSKLPRLTRQGGRYLVSDDGVRIDLLAEDPLLPLAEAVVQRIDGLDDRIAASSLVLCQPDVLVSSRVLTGAAYSTNPGSVLWVGGAFCDVYSSVVAALMERVTLLSGKRLPTGQFFLPNPPGTSRPWPNHWWGCVWLDRGLAIVDAELGRFFYRRDGRTLATVSDLFADPSLADAAGLDLGDYFRLCKPADGAVRLVPHWRETRPAANG